VQFEMSEHFMDASAIKDAVIDGELDTVVELAERLADREGHLAHPPDWRPHVDPVIAQAQGLIRATSVAEAAVGVAQLGGACADCHVALEVMPPFDDAVEPSDDESPRAVMLRHQWATDRLWEGLVGPSDWAWTHGADHFRVAPGCEGDVRPDVCATLESFGPRLVATTEPAARRVLFGELLGTCAACHAPGA
jgi:mono/diheme cytochrome c family protein